MLQRIVYKLCHIFLHLTPHLRNYSPLNSQLWAMSSISKDPVQLQLLQRKQI
jgi:hypothetical protein